MPGAVDFSDREVLEAAVSDNGTVTLAWEVEDGVEVELQQARDVGFEAVTTRYRGSDRGSVLTGLAEGEHFFRIGVAGSGEWSAPLKTEVSFTGRATLFWLLGAGGVVVAATVGAIVSGWLATTGKEGGGA